MADEQKRWTDARLDALANEVELLRHISSDVLARLDATNTRIDKLAVIVELHEKKWRQIERSFAAALRAGLQAWDENGEQR